MFETLGYITAAVLAVIAAIVAYHVIKGLFVGIDLLRWKMVGIGWDKIRSVKNYKRELIKLFFGCWGECIGYNGGISYSRGSRRWNGYGTGR